ncbi:hypothetical protein ACFXKG_24295 [Streptomyces sp. NPDC059255]|uniref:COG1470 family protein n=1 Tax=Streptomyces sp. NPDC059255 TaxID=3346793 RepID=UPI003678FAC2
MTLWTSLEPASTTVDPGSSTTVRLRLRNTGDVVDEYRFEPVGDVAPYVVVEPPTLRLYPGTTGAVELTFSPPRTPDSTAGPHPFGVRVLPTENPDATTVTEGNITFTPFMEVRAELVPPTVKGRFRGRPKLAVDNLGNTKLTGSISGSDNGDQLSYEIAPSNVQIEPGRAAFVDATLKPRQITWAGQKQSRPYELTVRRSGTEPLPVAGTYLQRSVLPYWLMTVLSLLLALTIAGLVLWFTFQPNFRSMAKEVPLGNAAASALPDAPEAKPDKPALEDAPEEKPVKQDDGDGDGGGGGGGGGDQEEQEEEQEAPSGPLPITSADKPNLFVQFAQVRMATGRSNECTLTGDYQVGKLDKATRDALACFQKTNDEKYSGLSTLEETDGLGRLGRSTMTALLAAHFGAVTSVPLEEGKEDPEVPWVRNIMLWSSNVEIDEAELATTMEHTRDNITYLRVSQKPTSQATKNLTNWIKSYQALFDIEQTGTVDEVTLRQWKAGMVKDQAEPGTVSAESWLPTPVE